MDEHKALAAAVDAGRTSPCVKSKRGVVIFRRGSGLISARWNAPPTGFLCDGSDACKAACGKLCVHAEQSAILDAQLFGKPIARCEMLHVKVVDGKAVPSGGPSCVDCSKLILAAGITAMWLLETGPDGHPVLIRYAAEEFHRKTLENLGLPIATLKKS